jgi:hypothetical protein
LNAESPTSTVGPIEYASGATRGKSWVRVGIWVCCLISVVALGVRFGPGWAHRAQVMYWQRQCVNDAPAAGTVVYEEDAVEAGTLLKSGRDFFAYAIARGPAGTSKVDAAARVPEYWWKLEGLLALRAAGVARGGPGYGAVVYLGERVSPGGKRRLICVRYQAGVSTFAAAWVAGFDYHPTVLTRAEWDGSGGTPSYGMWAFSVLSGWPQHEVKVRMYAGQADAKDRSHFTIRYFMWGQEDTLDGYLGDDQQVTLRPRKPPVDR